MIHDTLTATAAQYHQRWQHYLHEQEAGRRSKRLTRSERAWCDGAVMERMARAALDQASIMAIIDAELRGDTCLHHMIIMVPNVEHDPMGDYVLLVDDRPPMRPEAQAQRQVADAQAALATAEAVITRQEAEAEQLGAQLAAQQQHIEALTGQLAQARTEAPTATATLHVQGERVRDLQQEAGNWRRFVDHLHLPPTPNYRRCGRTKNTRSIKSNRNWPRVGPWRRGAALAGTVWQCLVGQPHKHTPRVDGSGIREQRNPYKGYARVRARGLLC